jgi:hydrogenase maturation protease
VTPIPAGRLIVGIGNAFRSDDGVGLWVARRLREQLPSSVSIAEASGEGAALIETWKGFASVILVDAVNSGASPGTIHRLDAATEPIRAQFFRCSSHAFGVGEAVELARELGQLPPRLIIYGIEGAVFAAGAELSPAVAKAAAEVAEQLLAEIRS